MLRLRLLAATCLPSLSSLFRLVVHKSKKGLVVYSREKNRVPRGLLRTLGGRRRETRRHISRRTSTGGGESLHATTMFRNAVRRVAAPVALRAAAAPAKAVVPRATSGTNRKRKDREASSVERGRRPRRPLFSASFPLEGKEGGPSPHRICLCESLPALLRAR